jgi:predicted DNA-binding transcriptional regulator YafY
MTTRGSEWNSFLRVLAMLRRLMEGPATNEQLIQAVLQSVGTSAYPASPTARQAALKHDRTHLKKRLKVNYIYLPESQQYILNDAGPYGRVSISPEMLHALMLLSRQYDNAVGEQAGVRDLVQQIIGWLSPELRMKLEDSNEAVTLDFEQDVDRSVISPRVQERIERALHQHRKLMFNYLSPRRPDRKAVFHEIAPYQLRFQDGHWYLRGYSLNNAVENASFLRFRVSYILDDEHLAVSPSKVETRHLMPPRFSVQYLLLPEVGRGEISHRFPETKITRHDDGSAEVHAVTDDIWDAARTLLAYGEACIVLGGIELRREMERRVKGMARNYEFYSEGL